MNSIISITDLERYLESYGWKFGKQNDNELLIRFVGENTNTEFHLIISLSDNWVALTVWPYLFQFPPERELDGVKEVCKTNFDLKLARLAMKSTGEITLCIDLPATGLTESMFHIALDVISYYADNLYPKFLIFWDKG